jgi:hypothetical protein
MKKRRRKSILRRFLGVGGKGAWEGGFACLSFGDVMRAFRQGVRAVTDAKQRQGKPSSIRGFPIWGDRQAKV